VTPLTAADPVVTGPSTSPEPPDPRALSARPVAAAGPVRGARSDFAIRVAGLVVAVVAAVVSAVVEVFLVPLRLGGVLVGLSLVLAIAGNITLVWFTHRATGWMWAVAVPALAWFAVFLPAAGRTTEGDLLLTGDNWVAMTTILGGSVALAVGAARLILLRRPPTMGRGFR
jgi:hypothetical protein